MQLELGELPIMRAGVFEYVPVPQELMEASQYSRRKVRILVVDENEVLGTLEKSQYQYTERSGIPSPGIVINFENTSSPCELPPESASLRGLEPPGPPRRLPRDPYNAVNTGSSVILFPCTCWARYLAISSTEILNSKSFSALYS